VVARRQSAPNDVLNTSLFIQGGNDNKEFHEAMGLDATILTQGQYWEPNKRQSSTTLLPRHDRVLD
jgi:hypothetical protein